MKTVSELEDIYLECTHNIACISRDHNRNYERAMSKVDELFKAAIDLLEDAQSYKKAHEVLTKEVILHAREEIKHLSSEIHRKLDS